MYSVTKYLSVLLTMTLITSCAEHAAPQATRPGTTTPDTGIDTHNFDDHVRAQDDFYRHVNGGWLDRTPIPADKAVWGSFVELQDDAEKALHGIVEQVSRAHNTPGSEAQKIGDLYADFMDRQRLQQLGLAPLAPELARIAAISSKDRLPALIAHLAILGVNTPLVPFVHQDNKDSTRYVVDLYQGGLGLPDRDYYLKTDDARLAATLKQYRAHVQKMLALAGDDNAAQQAQAIVSLETALANAHWTKVENRDPVKTYNRYAIDKLSGLAPGYDWNAFLRGAGIAGKVDYLIVSQPSYITGFNQVLQDMPLDTWKAYFRWHLLSDYAPYLSSDFVDENFAFYGTTLRGVPENRPRWKRGLGLIDNAIGEALGKLYVQKYFPPAHKARMEELVNNLLRAYRGSMDTLPWMGPETRVQAQAKLARFTYKIGYPNKWRDYSALTITRGDLVGNVMRAQKFDYDRNIRKLGKPIDREEWSMTPQTVNAYYNPEKNEIVFPAAILQPPFFFADADDAVNYGGIGAVIGHEISHGFDDRGSQYDGDGNLHDWWTAADHKRFRELTGRLVAQYDAYQAVPGYHVNGKLTLGENIADNAGLAIAYKAYHLALGGKPAPVLDGFSGDQRFFMSWAQIWRAKVREQEAIRRVKIDPHSPPFVRGTAPLENQAAFYRAFDVKPGDGMWRDPDQRVTIW